MIVPAEPLANPWDAARALRSGSGRQPGLSGSDQVELFGYARQALIAGLSALRPGTLLAPAYICDTAIDLLPALGYPVKFYPLQDDLSPDWEWLDRNRLPEDTSLLLVHYFGSPADIPAAVEFCRYATLSLIEDCAHSFLSDRGGEPLGSTGDLAVYSYRKTLPLRTGAALYSATGIDIPAASANLSNTNIWALWRMVGWAASKTRLDYAAPVARKAIGDGDGYERVSSSGIDRYSQSLMDIYASRVSAIKEKRRANYAALRNELRGLSGIAPLLTRIGDGACPWAFPLRVEDRDDLLARLWARRIGAWAWPPLPRSLAQEQYPNDVRRAGETLLLPIHQDIAGGHIKHMAREIEAWSLEQPAEKVTWRKREQAGPPGAGASGRGE